MIMTDNVANYCRRLREQWYGLPDQKQFSQIPCNSSKDRKGGLISPCEKILYTVDYVYIFFSVEKLHSL